MNKILSIKFFAIAALSYLSVACQNDSNLNVQKDQATKSLIKVYLKSIRSNEVIQISSSPYGAVGRSCLNDIFSRYKFDIPFEETFQAQETDTVSWSRSIIDADSVKILTASEVKLITQEGGLYSSDETPNKTFYVISSPIFSKDYRFAILNKYFYCGARCGKGSVLIFERKGSEWVLQEDVCPIVS